MHRMRIPAGALAACLPLVALLGAAITEGPSSPSRRTAAHGMPRRSGAVEPPPGRDGTRASPWRGGSSGQRGDHPATDGEIALAEHHDVGTALEAPERLGAKEIHLRGTVGVHDAPEDLGKDGRVTGGHEAQRQMWLRASSPPTSWYRRRSSPAVIAPSVLRSASTSNCSLVAVIVPPLTTGDAVFGRQMNLAEPPEGDTARSVDAGRGRRGCAK